jgi:aminoglycoside phosphotransferase (APT) family kinase protein
MRAMQLLDRVELIGKGLSAKVFAWGDGRVLKLFHEPVVRSRVEREFTATRLVHSAGLPAPAAYEMVEVEGKLGIVFERVEGRSLLGLTQARPWKIFEVIRQAAELHADINRASAPAGLRTLHERIAKRIDVSDASDSDKQAARSRLAALPDGTSICHGDFHPDNVLLTSRGPVVIDWSAASRGHPVGDLACTSRLMKNASLPPWAPWYGHFMLLGLRSAMHRSYLKWYFRQNAGSRREVEAWQLPLAVAGRAWRITG